MTDTPIHPGKLYVPQSARGRSFECHGTYFRDSEFTTGTTTVTEVAHVEFTPHHVVFHGIDNKILALPPDQCRTITETTPEDEGAGVAL